MKKLIGYLSLALVALTMIAVDMTTAAPPVGTAKARGDYSSNYRAQAGGRSIRHARDYSRGYQSYASQAPSITPQIAQEEAVGVGQNIASAQKHFAEVRKETTDKETLASLEVINTQLAAAAKAHQQMHELCTMETVDGVDTMKCCEDIDAALTKALAEQEKLMKRLQVETPATASRR